MTQPPRTSLLSQIMALMRREYLFQGLNDTQMEEIAARFVSVELDRNQLLFEQNDLADSFYLVLSGSVRVVRRTRSGDRRLNVLGPGDFFGEQALVLRRRRSAAVEGEEDSTLLRMDGASFHAMLAEFPAVRENLLVTARSRDLVRSLSISWLGSDEVIYLLVRKHDVFLILSLLLPIFLMILAIPLFMFAVVNATLAGNLALWGSFIVGLIGVGGAIWSWVDWSNDYYAVSNRRVVWVERVFGLYESRREAPLEVILSVNVSTTLLGRMLKYGDVNVKTFTGGLLLHRVPRPELFAKFVEGYKTRVRMISLAQEEQALAQELETSLRKRLGLPPAANRRQSAVQPPAPPPAAARPGRWGRRAPAVAPVKPVAKPGGKPAEPLYPGLWATFLKTRYEVDGVITYRKHWFLLVQKAWQPVLLGIVIVLAWAGLVSLQLGAGASAYDLVFFYGLVLFGGIFDLAWLIYYYWDWSNDVYRLTREQIQDIERQPLGDEIKKTANLDAILSIEHERANIIGILLNFGTVVVNIGQAKFDFVGVHNPNEVHQDIANYREAAARKKQTDEAERARKRLVDQLVTYRQVDEMLEDQQKNADWDAI